MAKNKDNKDNKDNKAEIDANSSVGIPSGFKMVRQVTAAVWKWNDNSPRYVRFETAIAQGKAQIRAKKTGTDSTEPMKVAHIAQVTNLLDNKRYTLVIGEVLRGDLMENYKDDSYVGKCFAIEKNDIPGKRYKGYTVQEIAPVA